MGDDKDQQLQPSDEEIEREIRQGRKLTANEVMARLAGPGAMKGASPVSPVQQAESEIGTWLRDNISDPGGGLEVVLCRNLKGSELLLESLDKPLAALAAYCRNVLEADYLLKELVREADVEWGRAMDERPHFEREGAPPDPDDPYTEDRVRTALRDVVERLSRGNR